MAQNAGHGQAELEDNRSDALFVPSVVREMLQGRAPSARPADEPNQLRPGHDLLEGFENRVFAGNSPGE